MSIQFSSSLPQTTQQLPNGQSINNNIILGSALPNKQINQHHNIGVDGRTNLGIEEAISEDEARRRREQLNRRPSYRMILKDLETVGDKPLKKELEESLTNRSHHHHLSHNQHLATSSGMGGDGPSSYESSINVSSASMLRNRNNSETTNTSGMILSGARLNVASTTPRMFNTNANITQQQPQQNSSSPLLSATAAAAAVAAAVGNSLVLPTSGCEIINLKPLSSLATDALSITVSSADSTFSQNNDWQNNLLYNSNHHPAAAGNSSLTSGGIIQANTPGSITSLSDNDDSNRKRQVRLLKNREAAKECRRKKKEYVKCLENRVAVLENQNKALIEELKTLKELYCRKEKSEIP